MVVAGLAEETGEARQQAKSAAPARAAPAVRVWLGLGVELAARRWRRAAAEQVSGQCQTPQVAQRGPAREACAPRTHLPPAGRWRAGPVGRWVRCAGRVGNLGRWVESRNHPPAARRGGHRMRPAGATGASPPGTAVYGLSSQASRHLSTRVPRCHSADLVGGAHVSCACLLMAGRFSVRTFGPPGSRRFIHQRRATACSQVARWQQCAMTLGPNLRCVPNFFLEVHKP